MLRSALTIVTLSLHGEFFTFSVALSAAVLSISIPVIWAFERCAAIMDISPVPAPMSSIRLLLVVSNHAPSRQPSVPTFMAQPSCSIVNCLNLK